MLALRQQLGHTKKGEVQKAYDRTRFDDRRRQVMQKWANYLDALRDDTGKVTPIRKLKMIRSLNRA